MSRESTNRSENRTTRPTHSTKSRKSRHISAIQSGTDAACITFTFVQSQDSYRSFRDVHEQLDQSRFAKIFTIGRTNDS